MTTNSGMPIKKIVPIKDAAEEFLACHRIAVTGVSRTPASHGANVVYKRLRDRKYEVFAVNPNATTVEGDTSYPNLAAIPGRVDAVIIATSPEHDHATIESCIALGIHKVWMHRPIFGPGSVSSDAAVYARAHGITVIEGGCPLMFGPTSDGAHCMMRTVGTWVHTVPREVAQPVGSL
jgi:predicted CoA-binding protein